MSGAHCHGHGFQVTFANGSDPASGAHGDAREADDHNHSTATRRIQLARTLAVRLSPGIRLFEILTNEAKNQVHSCGDRRDRGL
jgi:hypothetical protein